MVIQKCKCGTPIPEFAEYTEYTCPKCGRPHLVGDIIQKADEYNGRKDM
jgi:DNA-directed RNA polymerase subunit RPC12/RpoP